MAEPEIKEEIPEAKPEEAKPDEPPPAPLGLDQEGTGPGDSFGLAGRPGGNGLVGSGGGGGGTKWAGYSNRYSTAISALLNRDPRLKKASTLALKPRIWLDGTGRITRVELGGSTGNAEIDRAIKELMLSAPSAGPPPPDMPQPIILRVKAQR
ncbi:hypothetical protein D3874_05500 [Oleomonas cavernae]|uniref:Energy transducer TonB n=1 Tax=Oleomonas cavernae TaxID=2320859 RepID=A0A418W959_9PROT|nr:hypothetical protein [Oleomonas cavernae]RJF86543.1 hypothetical protein D3874_05500 [Oleomonas cavernae]